MARSSLIIGDGKDDTAAVTAETPAGASVGGLVSAVALGQTSSPMPATELLSGIGAAAAVINANDMNAVPHISSRSLIEIPPVQL
jgi:hypothetical protein